MEELRGSCYPGRKMVKVGWCFQGQEVRYLMKYPGRSCRISYKNLRRLDIGKCLEDWGKISSVAIGIGRYLGEFRGSRYRGREIRDWG